MTRTLYKLNTSGQISWWKITLSNNTVTIEWGHRLPICESQNIVTEELTSPEEAEAEYYSRIRKQVDRRGYEDSPPSCKPLMPMLCQEYKKLSPPKFQSFALQPKLDGIRALISKEQIVSRRNTLLRSIPHIELYANHLPDDIILDGELIIKNTPLNIIESYVMRSTPDLKVCKEIEYHIFDVVDTEAPFIERMKVVQDIFESLEDRYTFYRQSPKSPYKDHPYFSHKFPFKIVPTYCFEEPIPKDDADSPINIYFDECIAAGQEGIIIRNLEGPYQIDVRSKHILKMKEFFDNEFQIIDVVRGKADCGIFVCKTHNGETFSCSFKGTHPIRKQQLKDRLFYIGKWLTISHEGIGDSGRPRCPVGIHWYAKKDHE